MTLPKLEIEKIKKEIQPNKRGDYKETIDTLFFYEGIKKIEGRNPRVHAKLIDYRGQEIDAIIWENNWKISNMYDYEDKFVARIKGYLTYYNDSYQITINEINPISPDDPEYNTISKIYISYKQKLDPAQKEEYAGKLLELIETVNNKYYKQLLKDLFDSHMISTFKEWTAAWERHHAFPGGLLVHTVNVATKCKAIAEVSNDIDQDLLVTAALLHDIAKVDEYEGFPSKRRLYKGRMLYHAYMGAEKVAIKINEYRTSKNEAYLLVSDFPEALEVQLKHCILSHHGLPEYGAAVKPMILEANILHLMDDADAQEQYYKEKVIDAKEFDAEMPIDKIRGFYDDLSKSFSYPTMRLEPYSEEKYYFALALNHDDSEPSYDIFNDDGLFPFIE